ncbi:MAG: hypothetical protein ACPL1K_08255, partial [Candidatus Kryptoniota bacterium]
MVWPGHDFRIGLGLLIIPIFCLYAERRAGLPSGMETHLVWDFVFQETGGFPLDDLVAFRIKDWVVWIDLPLKQPPPYTRPSGMRRHCGLGAGGCVSDALVAEDGGRRNVAYVTSSPQRG